MQTFDFYIYYKSTIWEKETYCVEGNDMDDAKRKFLDCVKKGEHYTLDKDYELMTDSIEYCGVMEIFNEKNERIDQ